MALTLKKWSDDGDALTAERQGRDGAAWDPPSTFGAPG